MDIVIRAVILGVVGSVLALVIRKNAPEIGLVLTLAVALLVVGLGAELIRTILDFADTLQTAAGLSPALIGPVLKTVGIGILTRIAADICKDAGQGAIASTVELAGTVAALYIALPLMQTVFSMIGGLL
ncbi:MAG: stage III sporulation AC/AD family protein [Oscillospiraceae bacterium]|nr:stage III sporulation AC/AD family protein [Oscillospiraceae bacterium]